MEQQQEQDKDKDREAIIEALGFEPQSIVDKKENDSFTITFVVNKGCDVGIKLGFPDSKYLSEITEPSAKLINAITSGLLNDTILTSFQNFGIRNNCHSLVIDVLQKWKEIATKDKPVVDPLETLVS